MVILITTHNITLTMGWKRTFAEIQIKRISHGVIQLQLEEDGNFVKFHFVAKKGQMQLVVNAAIEHSDFAARTVRLTDY